MPNEMRPWAFVLAVPDINRSAAYFRDVLGFRISWEEAPDWRLVERGGVRMMLGHCPKERPAADIGSHNWFGYLDVDEVDQLHAEFTARGAACAGPFEKSYGMREIIVTTIDGHRIVFGQEIGRKPP